MIAYRSGFKHVLAKTVEIRVTVYPSMDLKTDGIALDQNGVLIIHKGYPWDGASGPAFDSKAVMRASLVHDALYQLMREGLLGQDWRARADLELQKIYKQDAETIRQRSGAFKGFFIGVFKPARAWWLHAAVRVAGAPSADPKNRKKILYAP